MMDEMSRNQGTSSSRGSNLGNSGGDGEITAIKELLDNGEIKVGKIRYNPDALLGTGCQGTFVYK